MCSGGIQTGIGASYWPVLVIAPLQYNVSYSEPVIICFSYLSCSGDHSPGLAADMHFRDNVIAFIGPACAFALEPVARLAAYWNTPIITGMGDQVQNLTALFINL